MEYILFIHNNEDHASTQEQWSTFFSAANDSGIFNGGSEITESHVLGTKPIHQTTKSVVGVMRFETDDMDKLNNLLKLHSFIFKVAHLSCVKCQRLELQSPKEPENCTLHVGMASLFSAKNSALCNQLVLEALRHYFSAV